MGVAFSRPLSDFYELDSRLAAAILRSLSFSSGGDLRTALRSLSFKGGTLGRGMVRSYGPGMIMVDGPSPRFKDRELDSPLSFHTPSADMENEIFGRPFSCRVPDQVDQLASWDGWSEKKSPLPGDHRYHAAVKLQKVYKSFRTRRQLADCAVVVEQKWWKLLDFAELKRSSISFFDIEKPETAVSRWSRAKRRAAKVGKGLSKDEKARKLALQHWLEAIDPRHRYGHNLQFYYAKWLHCQSKQPFFYWLDIGEGKEVNLERCPRSKLQQQCIKYLGPTERKAYAVVVEDGKFLYKPSGKLLDTRGGPKDAKWIFVLSTSKTLYVGQKNKGTFQHSSFLAGGATLSAGRLVVEDGVLKAVWPHSGHYLPTEENFQEFMSFLQEHNVDLTNVKKSPSEEEEENITYIGSIGSVRQNESSADSSEVSEATNVESLAENEDTRQQDSNAETNANLQTSKLSRGLRSKISRLEIPSRTDMFNIFMKEAPQPSLAAEPPNCPSDEDYESAEDSFLTEEDFMLTKATLFDEDEEEEEEEPIPKEEIIRRIVSHKGMKSYQLAEQLSSKWTTGAGPRIGCMRDYPSELQSRVLAQAKLSPRPPSGSSPRVTSRFSPRVLTPTPLRREATSRSSLAPDQRVLRQTATP